MNFSARIHRNLYTVFNLNPINLPVTVFTGSRISYKLEQAFSLFHALLICSSIGTQYSLRPGLVVVDTYSSYLFTVVAVITQNLQPELIGIWIPIFPQAKVEGISGS